MQHPKFASVGEAQVAEAALLVKLMKQAIFIT